MKNEITADDMHMGGCGRGSNTINFHLYGSKSMWNLGLSQTFLFATYVKSYAPRDL